MTYENILLTVIKAGAGKTLALGRAEQFAKPMGAAIELFTCCYDEHIAGTRFFNSPQQSAAREKMVNDARASLEELAKPMREAGLTVTAHACWDRPEHEAIARRAIEVNARMVFSDCEYHNVISRAIFSHEDWQLIRTAPRPLMLVKKERRYRTPPKIWVAVDPMHSHEKPESLDSDNVTLAKAVANSLQGTLDVVHTYDPASALAAAAAPAVIPAPLPLDKITEEMRDSHAEHLHRLTDTYDIDRARVHLISGSARTVLPGAAIENDIDLLIMGAVARTGLDKLVIGSTAEKILDHLPCDVIIVKPASVYEKLASSLPKGHKSRFVA